MRDASFINDIADDMEDPLRTMTADSQSDRRTLPSAQDGVAIGNASVREEDYSLMTLQSILMTILRKPAVCC